MAKVNAPLFALNRGEVSRDALTRVDVEKMRLSSECQVNWSPSALGSMMLRPGTVHLGSTKSDAAAKFLPFIFASDDTALLEFTDQVMRVWKSDALITRGSVSTTVTNGDFSSSVGWTLTASSGSTASISGGVLTLAAAAYGGTASCEREVTVGASDQNDPHALRIIVNAGSAVTFQVGSSSGAFDYVAPTSLAEGTHSIAFTPTGNFFVRFSVAAGDTPGNQRKVDSIQVESSGTLELPTPWVAADLDLIRHAQSGDIVYVAAAGYQQRQIERRDNDSWSVVKYKSPLGPFIAKPTWADGITMEIAGQTGNRNLDSSRDFFTSDMAGMLIRLPNVDQKMVRQVGAGAQFTDTIRLTGIGAQNDYTYTISGTYVGTISHQISYTSKDTGFTTRTTHTGTGAVGVAFGTDHDNVITWSRWGFAEPSDYTSGNFTITIGYTSGEDFGVARIITFTDADDVEVEMTKPMKSSNVTKDWEIGEWSTYNTWPSAVAFWDGRLWWSGRDRIWGSVSDDFTNFDDTTEGESAPIQRSIGSGPVATINWLLPLTRLIVGCEDREVPVRASALDEPVTPTNITLKPCSTQGSANLPALQVDTRGVFVEKSGRRVYELVYNVEFADYQARDLTRFNEAIGVPGFVDLAAQRQPETYLHFVRSDGELATLLQFADTDGTRSECWFRTMTLGVIENVVVLPGSVEDAVYVVVKRSIAGSTKRFLERFALRSQCVGGSLSRNLDSHVVVSQASSTTVSGLSHLEGELVYVWGNGKDLGSYTVSSGSITVSEAVTTAIVGLGGISFSYDSSTAATNVTAASKYNGYPAEVFANGPQGGKLRYVGTVTVASGVITLPNGKSAKKIIAYLGLYGPYRSAKLAYGAQMGTALTQQKRVQKVGLILYDCHFAGLKVGGEADNLQPLPTVIGAQDIDADTVFDEHEESMHGISGSWTTDNRLHLLAQAPKPVTVGGVVVQVDTSER